MKFLILYLLMTFCNVNDKDMDPVVFSKDSEILKIGHRISILEDKTGRLGLNQVLKSDGFKKCHQEVPNMGISASAFWIKFQIQNLTNQHALVLELAYPILDQIELYKLESNKALLLGKTGEDRLFSSRKYKHQNYMFDLNLNKGETGFYYMKISSAEEIFLPLSIGSSASLLEADLTKDLIAGIYFGIILAVFFYNIFIFFSVKDKSYLFYVIYIVLIGLTQACLQGYGFKYLWPDAPWFANHSMYLVPSLVGIAAMLFFKIFLKTHSFLPLFDKGLAIFIAIYILCIVLGLAGKNRISQVVIQVNAVAGSFYVLYGAIRIYIKKYRPATFYLISWSVFLSSVCVFVMRNFNILPFNNITFYSLQFGSAMEVLLLSFALADHINVLKKEKENSQLTALKVLQENERIIKEQNIILEQNVASRTAELSATLFDLKEAQYQLVSAEKMASLGQFTAGITHEINNPINFVMSNIAPLKRDIKELFSILYKYDQISTKTDLKRQFEEIDHLKKQLDSGYLMEEIDALLNGIYEGATRTTEIVRGMKSFSRLDEFDFKLADVNEGLETTIALLKSVLTDKILIKKDLGHLPPIKCYPGKLNQVFMNIINNAAQAIFEKNTALEDGLITISSSVQDSNVIISIKDNGIGMSSVTLSKIFDPFFTTKEVGKGTGLGMSISYTIIKNHHGKIKVSSEEFVGSEFLILLPVNAA